MKLILLILMISFWGCSSVELDEKLVDHWSDQAQRNEPFRTPYISTFKKGDKELIYIAVEHANSLQSKTFKTIKDVITKEKPRFIVLEGFSNKDEINPQWFLDYSDKCEKSQFKNCGEPAYAAMLADRETIPFAGGEPTDIEVFNDLVSHGFFHIDAVSFYLLRQIPQLKRQHKLKRDNFNNQAQRYLNHFSSDFGQKDFIRFEEFEKWFTRHSKSQKNYLEITSQDVAPIKNQDSTFFNKISATISLTREKFLNQVIETKLNEYSKVLVIYGGGHLVKSRKVYEKYFGPSEDRQVN